MADEERSLNTFLAFAHLRKCSRRWAGLVSFEKPFVRKVLAGMWLWMLFGNLTKNVCEVYTNNFSEVGGVSLSVIS